MEQKIQVGMAELCPKCGEDHGFSLVIRPAGDGMHWMEIYSHFCGQIKVTTGGVTQTGTSVMVHIPLVKPDE